MPIDLSSLAEGAATGGISTALSGASGLLGSLINALGIGRNRQIRSTKDLMNYQAELEYDWNQKAADADFARQLQLYEKQLQRADYEWQRDADYNNPAAMRSRLTSAGMLGASLFAGGNVGVPSSSANPSPSSAGRSQGVSIGFPDEHLVGPNSFDAFFKSAMSLAQLDNLKASTDDLQSSAGLKSAQTATEQFEASLKQLNVIGEEIRNRLTDLNREFAEQTLTDRVGFTNNQFLISANNALEAAIDVATKEYHRKNIQPLERVQLANNIQVLGAQVGMYGALTRLHNAGADLSIEQRRLVYQMTQGAILNNQLSSIDVDNAWIDQSVRYGGAIRWVSDSKGHRKIEIKPVTFYVGGKKQNLFGTEFLRQMNSDALTRINASEADNYKLRFYLDYLFKGMSTGARVVGAFGGGNTYNITNHHIDSLY